MGVKKILFVFGLFMAFLFFASPPGWAQRKPGTSAPIISNSFAVEKGEYGYIWKIYIEAEDPDGDMLRIASVVHQVGYGNYPTDWIFLKSPYRGHFKGYIQWNTFSSSAVRLPEWTQITLKVSIFDKAGNESNEVVFPFTFESGVRNRYSYALPPPFDQGNLPRVGYIATELMNPYIGFTGYSGARDD